MRLIGKVIILPPGQNQNSLLFLVMPLTDVEKTEQFPNYAKLMRDFLKRFPWSICYDPMADDHRQIISEMPGSLINQNESKDQKV